MPNTTWSEKDDAALKAIIVNILNQEHVFSDLSTGSILSRSFDIQNQNEYKLGLFTGVIINMFANYWINEHETGLTIENIENLHTKISDSKDMILEKLRQK